MKNKVSLSLLFFFALALQVHGWWDTGHMLVSQIAWKHLSNNPTEVSAEVLRALENAVNSLVSYSPPSNTFVTAACWMDDIKNRNLHQFDNWHYINLPICDFPNSTDTDSCDGISVESVLNSGDEDVLWGITMANSTIRGSSALGFERGFALRNLLHMIGDLHQPLHAVARFSPQTPNGDEGGNLFPITGVSFTKNLHGFWDSGLGQLNNGILRPLNQSASDYLSTTADSMIARVANRTANLTTVNVTEWAMESRYLAMTFVYNLTFNSTPSEYYIQQGWEVVQDQIGMAGYRLYLVLKGMRVCNSDNSNCPEPETVVEKKETVWFVIGIVLAAALGVSLIVNIIFIVRASNRRKYSPVQ